MSTLEEFDAVRPRLFAIAYRMLGTMTDAEDALQEAWLRWSQTDRAAVQSAEAFLTSVVTRLCIDQLRSARARREHYVGPWLPEPLVGKQAEPTAELADSLSMAFLVILESLSATERAVFLLHDVFGYSFAEVAEIVGETEVNCRQIARRSRQRIHNRRPRFPVDARRQEALAAEFFAACISGDLDRLKGVLAEDVVTESDGGGLVPAARKPIVGADRVARFLTGVYRKAPAGMQFVSTYVNGQPGGILSWEGKPITIYSLDIIGDRVQGIFIIRNPEKMRHLMALPAPAPASAPPQ